MPYHSNNCHYQGKTKVAGMKNVFLLSFGWFGFSVTLQTQQCYRIFDHLLQDFTNCNLYENIKGDLHLHGSTETQGSMLITPDNA